MDKLVPYPTLFRSADGQRRVLRRGRADGVGAGAGAAVAQQGALADQREDVVELPSCRMAGAQAEAVDPPGARQPARSCHQAFQRRRLGEAGDLVAHGSQHLGGQRMVALQLLLLELCVRLAEKAATLAAQSVGRSEEHTSELQSLMRISYAVFCLKK